jgi:hypothetical protein
MHPGFSARIFFETFYLPERRIPDYGKETILACGMPLPYLRISGFSECRVLWSERCLKHNAYTVRWYVLAMAMSLIDHYSLVGQASMKLRCPAQWSSWAYLWAAYSLQAKRGCKLLSAIFRALRLHVAIGFLYATSFFRFSIIGTLWQLTGLLTPLCAYTKPSTYWLSCYESRNVIPSNNNARSAKCIEFIKGGFPHWLKRRSL